MPNPKLETYKNKATGTVYDYTDAAAQAALADILDGTDIDSFSDVETALATKVDKVTGKGLSTNDYTNSAKGIVDNIQSNVIANTKLIKDTVGWSGKNKCPNDLVSYNANNTTITVNADKSVSLTTGSGGATADTWMVVHTYNPNELPAGNYKLLGCPSGGSNQKYEILFREDPAVSGGVSQEDFGNGASVTISDTSKTYKLFIGLKRGQTASNLTFKPMLYDANILDSTYEPYFGSTAFPRSEQAVLGARNLTPYLSSGDRVVGDTTFTVNDDGTVKINCSNNSAISDLYYLGTSDSTHVAGYDNWGIPVACSLRISCKGGTEQEGIAYILVKWTGSAGQAVVIIDNNTPSATFNYDPNTKYRLMLRANEGVTFTDKIVNPLITLSSDTSDDITPPAMTNRELTEKVNGMVDYVNTTANNGNAYTGSLDDAPLGFTYCSSGCTNNPVNKWGVAETIKASSSAKIQKFYSVETDDFCIRRMVSSVWQAWQKVTTTSVS